MKKNDINIDELFTKAKNEKLIISNSELESMLDGKILPAEKFRLINKFKRNKKMINIIGITAAAVGILFWNTLDFDSNKISDNSANIKNQVVKIEENTKNNSEPQVKEHKPILPIDNNLLANKSRHKDENTPPDTIRVSSGTAPVNGINSVEILPEELSTFGVYVDENGDFMDVYLDSSAAKPSRIYIDWGVSFNIKEKNDKSFNKNIIPSMITDNAGMRRIEVFNTADSKVHIDKKVFKNTHPDSKNNFDTTETTITIDENFDDKGLENSSKKITKKDKNIKIFTDNAQYNKLSNDSNIRVTVQTLRKTINIDSLSSGNTDLNNNIRILKDKRERNSEGIIIDKDNLQLTFDDGTDPVFINKNTLDINKLLPLKVKIPNAKDKNGKHIENFAFILWLDLNSKVYSKLPERIQKIVKPEFEAMTNSENAICGYSPNEDGRNFLDIWRTCSGAVENVKASPNPTNGIVNLSYELKENRNVTISVNDVFGKNVKTIVANHFNSKGLNQSSFDLTGLEAGMYLIVVQTNTGEQAVNRIILQN